MNWILSYITVFKCTLSIQNMTYLYDAVIMITFLHNFIKTRDANNPLTQFSDNVLYAKVQNWVWLQETISLYVDITLTGLMIINCLIHFLQGTLSWELCCCSNLYKLLSWSDLIMEHSKCKGCYNNLLLLWK